MPEQHHAALRTACRVSGRPGSAVGGCQLDQRRAEILHGTLESGPTAEGGYRVSLRIPLTTDGG
ncbi:hypothetical protein [Streptomyces sp. 1331.2]|uniref:hypothetical protein n=1 Tax=Streptomyces sp. 1331.2 TaxID=1938835 RepID=UPI000BE3DD13|nr:hypothetical protein [Streptomyces sp. 1331.2]